MSNTIRYLDTAVTGITVDIARIHQVLDMLGNHLQGISERVTILEDRQEGTDNLLDEMNVEEQHIVTSQTVTEVKDNLLRDITKIENLEVKENNGNR